MILTETIEVSEKKDIVIGYKCDCCGKIHNNQHLPNDWHNFSARSRKDITGYSTSEDYISCSPECYLKLLDMAIEDFKYQDTSDIDGFSKNFTVEILRYIHKLKNSNV